MPKWNGVTITNLGKDLQLKCQAGETLNFTKFKLGDGVYDGDEAIAEIIDLKSVKQILPINSCMVNQNHQCQISTTISNGGLEVGYYLRELGLYAEDPDEGEILYAISLDVDPDFLPEDGGTVTLSEKFNVLVNIGNVTDVTAVTDVGGWVTSGYVNQQIELHINDGNAHSDMLGASLETDGQRGMVPQPLAGDPNRCLRADGTWGVPENTKYSLMEGASATAAGKGGLLPQPRAGEQLAYLRGDGTWAKPSLQVYPVGSVFLTVMPVSPASVIGGTWKQIKDKFFLTVGDIYTEANTSVNLDVSGNAGNSQLPCFTVYAWVRIS